MKILLVRPKPKNLFAKLNIVCVEPLELEYLAAAALELGHQYVICDGLVEKTLFPDFLISYNPDIVALTGYTIHVNAIKEYASLVKAFRPDIPVIVGGIHAELNWQDFYHPSVNVVVHSNPVTAFTEVVTAIENGIPLDNLKNICLPIRQEQTLHWQKNDGEAMDPNKLPIPDRAHLLAHRKKFRYFGREECALVKTAWGCSFQCNFCYCALLNHGRYTARDLHSVMEEIKGIVQEKIFIIDDTFLVDIHRAKEFCQGIESHGIKKNFSIYSRADFICGNEEILPLLKRAGVEEIIIGLEAVDDQTLVLYGKNTTFDINRNSLELLKKYSIASCALFIVDHRYGKEDFRRLRQAIKKLNPNLCMFSIFTPLKGLPEYEGYRDKLVISEEDHEAYDFLHLIITPAKLSAFRFYIEFYRLYLSSLLNFHRLRKNLGPLTRSVLSLCRELPGEAGAAVNRILKRKAGNIWDYWATRYDKLWVQKYSLAPTRKLLIREIGRALDTKGSGPVTVLDAGCGTGQLAEELAAAYPMQRVSVTGVDFSQKMIEAAQKKQIPQARFLWGDAMKLPFSAASFDFLVCSHSLPYYKDKALAIREFKRVLKPGGNLFLINASVNSRYDKAVTTAVKFTTGKAHYPSSAATEDLLIQSGFSVLGQKNLSTSFFMPSIILTTAQGGS